MQTDRETLTKFALRHGLKPTFECSNCSTIVEHPPVKMEKTKDAATLYYEPCPGRKHGATSSKPLSATEKAHWQDLFWGLRGALEGYDPTFVPPQVVDLAEERIIHLGDEEPFAVIYLGTCAFVSLLAVANQDWDENEPPFCEENCAYTFALEKDGRWTLNVDPGLHGAKFVTAAYWEPPITRQRG